MTSSNAAQPTLVNGIPAPAQEVSSLRLDAERAVRHCPTPSLHSAIIAIIVPSTIFPSIFRECRTGGLSFEGFLWLRQPVVRSCEPNIERRQNEDAHDQINHQTSDDNDREGSL